MELLNLLLHNRPGDEAYDVKIDSSTISSITPSTKDSNRPCSLLLPSLCHPHIHLDKACLLSTFRSPNPQASHYASLQPQTGTFTEALQLTSKAKSHFTVPDLVHRGSVLIAESVGTGVTSMRAFVEVDRVTGTKTLEAGAALKARFRDVCEVQLCAFAQDPVCSTEYGDQNRKLMEDLLVDEHFRSMIEVLGSTPYVETTVEASTENINWAVRTALKCGLHLDFHLDYHLDEQKESMVWTVLAALKEQGWPKKSSCKVKTVVLGHCTRLTLFTREEMRRLAQEIEEADLPISFVGLPTSDLFMMGRPSDNAMFPYQRPRGTLQVLDMINSHSLNCCIGVNNVGNAFTPWGGFDPLKLASLAVGVYQDGTDHGARILYECVSTRARSAIGLSITDMGGLDVRQGSKGPWLLIKNKDEEEGKLMVGEKEIQIPVRQWRSVRDIVWDPPDTGQREVI
jgi:cytosine/adenosine deaminase-related metal-dependent hydrolase